MIVLPQFVTLDTNTLIDLCKDFLSASTQSRREARNFLDEAKSSGVHFVFTFTHVIELLRHADEQVAFDRLRCLRSMPLIAWLRPYSDEWFPGAPFDLVLRELHAYWEDKASEWRDIVAITKTRIFQTGTGEEMFVDNRHLWESWRLEALRQHEKEILISSIKRTDVGDVMKERVSDLRKLPKRTRDERRQFFRIYAREMHRQLEIHGDKRLEGKSDVAVSFASDSLQRIDELEDGVDDDEFENAIIDYYMIPREYVTAETTVDEVGDMAVHIKQLEILGRNLRPVSHLGISEVPIDALPSQVIERRISKLQNRADRVSGSDNGDGHIIPMAFYCSAVEVDKRTAEFTSQISKSDSRFKELLCPIIRSGDYKRTRTSLRKLGILR